MAYKFEKVTNSLSGQLQKENGSFWDLQKFLQLKEIFNVEQAAYRGEIYQSFWRGTIASGASLFFSQTFGSSSVALVRALTFKQTFTGKPIEISVRIGGSAGSTLEVLNGFNLDRRKWPGSPGWTTANPLRRVASLSGGTVVDRWMSLSSSSEAARTAAPIEDLQTIGFFSVGQKRSYEILNGGGGTQEVALSWAWQELAEAPTL